LLFKAKDQISYLYVTHSRQIASPYEFCVQDRITGYSKFMQCNNLHKLLNNISVPLLIYLQLSISFNKLAVCKTPLMQLDCTTPNQGHSPKTFWNFGGFH